MGATKGKTNWVVISAATVAVVATGIVGVRMATMGKKPNSMGAQLRQAVGMNADSQAHSTAKEMVRWLGMGTEDQKDVAHLALLAAPEAAASEVRAAGNDASLPEDLRKEMKETAERQEGARKYWAAQREAEEKWRLAGAAAYDVVGKRSPAWDAAARELIALGLPMVGLPDHGEQQKRELLGRKLGDLKCDDPIVRFLVGQLAETKAPVSERIPIARAALDSNYPPSWKAAALGWALDLQTNGTSRVPYTEDERRQAQRMWRDGLALLGRAEEEHETSDQRLYVMYVNAGAELMRAGRSIDAGWKPIASLRAEHHADDALGHTIHGTIYNNAYNDLRGTGMANTVADDAWGPMGNLLTAAIKEYNLAVAGPKPEPNAARRLVEVGLHAGMPREELEVLFVRAMQLNPDNRDVVRSYAFSRLGRWGDPNFAQRTTNLIRACALSRNFEAGIPQLWFELHHGLQQDEQADFRKYFKTPEMRQEAKYVYDEAARLSPDLFTLNAAFYAFCYANAYGSGSVILKMLPPDYEPVGLFKDWGQQRNAMLTNPDVKDDPIPAGNPPWVP